MSSNKRPRRDSFEDSRDETTRDYLSFVLRVPNCLLEACDDMWHTFFDRSHTQENTDIHRHIAVMRSFEPEVETFLRCHQQAEPYANFNATPLDVRKRRFHWRVLEPTNHTGSWTYHVCLHEYAVADQEMLRQLTRKLQQQISRTVQRWQERCGTIPLCFGGECLVLSTDDAILSLDQPLSYSSTFSNTFSNTSASNASRRNNGTRRWHYFSESQFDLAVEDTVYGQQRVPYYTRIFSYTMNTPVEPATAYASRALLERQLSHVNNVKVPNYGREPCQDLSMLDAQLSTYFLLDLIGYNSDVRFNGVYPGEDVREWPVLVRYMRALAQERDNERELQEIVSPESQAPVIRERQSSAPSQSGGTPTAAPSVIDPRVLMPPPPPRAPRVAVQPRVPIDARAPARPYTPNALITLPFQRNPILGPVPTTSVELPADYSPPQAAQDPYGTVWEMQMDEEIAAEEAQRTEALQAEEQQGRQNAAERKDNEDEKEDEVMEQQPLQLPLQEDNRMPVLHPSQQIITQFCPYCKRPLYPEEGITELPSGVFSQYLPGQECHIDCIETDLQHR